MISFEKAQDLLTNSNPVLAYEGETEPVPLWEAG